MAVLKNGVSRFFALLAMVLLLSGIGMVIQRENQLALWEKARAEVVEVAVLEGEPPRYAAVMRFDDRRGTRHRYRSDWQTQPPDYRVGDEISVYFNPAEPSTLVVNSLSGKHLRAMILLVCGVILVLVSVAARRPDMGEERPRPAP